MENLYFKDEMLSGLYLEPTDPVPPTPAPSTTTSNSSLDPKYTILLGTAVICVIIIIAKKH
jgi:hypothetical protein